MKETILIWQNEWRINQSFIEMIFFFFLVWKTALKRVDKYWHTLMLRIQKFMDMQPSYVFNYTLKSSGET